MKIIKVIDSYIPDYFYLVNNPDILELGRIYYELYDKKLDDSSTNVYEIYTCDKITVDLKLEDLKYIEQALDGDQLLVYSGDSPDDILKTIPKQIFTWYMYTRGQRIHLYMQTPDSPRHVVSHLRLLHEYI